MWEEHWKKFDGWEQAHLIDPAIKLVHEATDMHQVIGRRLKYTWGFLSNGKTQKHTWQGRACLCSCEVNSNDTIKLVLRIRIERLTEYAGSNSHWDPWDATESKIEITIFPDKSEIKRIWSEWSNLNYMLKDQIGKRGEQFAW